MSKLRPRYLRSSRENAGMVMPQLALHAALSDLPVKLREGTYARDAIEEKLILNMTDKQVDSCFHALQKDPPSLSLRFPADHAQLPMITIMRESINEEHSFIGELADSLDEELHVVNTETILTPTGGAVGGETEFILASTGELISNSVDKVRIDRGSTVIYLDRDFAEYSVTSADKTITLATPLVAGDTLTVERYTTIGLPGGDTKGHVLRFFYVIFIETANPLLTTFLEALVWREIMEKHDLLLANNIADIDIGFRDMSLWAQFVPTIAFRSEVTVSGLVTWLFYKRREVTPRSSEATFSDTRGVDDDLIISDDLFSWAVDPEICG